MAAKTTKAQRRAAKLNRRSKDYRRQIAAQARKEERAKKKAEEQTETRAKNPSPKKVYKGRIDIPQNVTRYNPLRDVAVAVIGNTDDELVIISGYTPRGLTPTELEDIIRAEVPSLKAIYVIQMPFGSSLDDISEAFMNKATVDFFEPIIIGMYERGEWFFMTDYYEFAKNLEASLVA